MERQVFGVVATVYLLLCGGSALAGNTACWGDDSRKDISCTRITEKLLLSLRGQSEDGVRKALGASGRDLKDGLHFLSNYSRGSQSGSGDLNVWFEDGKATSISAAVDVPNKHRQEFTWSTYATPPLGEEIDRSTKKFNRAAICSDLSGTPITCAIFETGMDKQLSLMQMQGNLPKADVARMLEAACKSENGLAVSDPTGDCPRLKAMLK